MNVPLQSSVWSAAQPRAKALVQIRDLEKKSGIETQEPSRHRGWADSEQWGSLDPGGGLGNGPSRVLLQQ